MSSKTTTSMKFKRLKDYDTIWHPESTLVFKSATDKFVVGRYVDGEMIKLDNKALEICKEWNFKYDESILTNEEPEEEAEETGEEEAGETDGEEEAGEEEAEETGGEEEVGEQEVGEEIEVSETKDETKDVVDFHSKFDYLNKYLNELSSSVVSHNNNAQKDINMLKDEISKKNKEYEILKNNYDDLENKYSVLKSKFDGIKNFFS